MIVKDQQNLKVHFAGLEQYNFSRVLHECSGVKYSLFTCFPFVAQMLKVKTTFPNDDAKKVCSYNQKMGRHVIMDSGLFTLMFGSHKGKKDKSFIYSWNDAIADFVNENDYRGTVVEVDCQKVLSVKDAWHLREKMANKISNRIINVFHLEDGQKGLEKLIEYSNYIAISFPELRIAGKKNQVEKLVNFIKNKKPEIDIHLLGCTEAKYLRKLSFCTTSDSTSWQSVNRYATMTASIKGKQTKLSKNQVDIDRLTPKFESIIADIIKETYSKPSEKTLPYLANYALSGILTKQFYTQLAGSQE